MLEFFITRARINNLFKNIFADSDKVLDIGCGERPYYHKNIGAEIICADIRQTKKAHFICDAMKIPIKKSSFDGVLCINSLYYYSNPFSAVKEFSRILKKNGKLVIVTPFIYPIHDAPDDKYRFTEYGIKEILKDDFNVKFIKPVGGIFNIPAVALHSLIKGLPLLVPKELKKFAQFFAIIIFYPFYILAQLLSLLDFLDKTGRWTTHYFTLAVKK